MTAAAVVGLSISAAFIYVNQFQLASALAGGTVSGVLIVANNIIDR